MWEYFFFQVDLHKETDHLLETGEGYQPSRSWFGNKVPME